MILFNTSVADVLSYNRDEYLAYLDGELDLTIKWYGASFQLNKEKVNVELNRYLQEFEPAFRSIVSMVGNDSKWVVNHDDKDLEWFPNDGNNLPQLRSIFKQAGISNKFKGALIFGEEDILKYARDLISYPYLVLNKDGLLYKDIDISSVDLQLIIKVSGHLNIDLISTDYSLLKRGIGLLKDSQFMIREYRSNL